MFEHIHKDMEDIHCPEFHQSSQVRGGGGEERGGEGRREREMR